MEVGLHVYFYKVMFINFDVSWILKYTIWRIAYFLFVRLKSQKSTSLFVQAVYKGFDQTPYGYQIHFEGESMAFSYF